ncbi:MAG: hypothetical protein LUD51_08155 [Clostridia bacterium]|nr:hypothetical protein [Clostridia bacterium]
MTKEDYNVFIEDLHYGTGAFVSFMGEVYMIDEDENDNGSPCIYVSKVKPAEPNYIFMASGSLDRYPVEKFLKAKIWGGKTFPEAYGELDFVQDNV